MSGQVAYRSTDAAVITAIESEKSARMKWGRQIRKLGREAFGVRKVDFYANDRTFVSFVRPPTVPEGWKAAPRRSPGIVPDKRTAAGKEWAKRLEPLRNVPGSDSPPGMPQGFFDVNGQGAYWRRPAYGVIDGVAWCRWGSEPKSGIDGGLWTKAKLSEFYAAAEAAGIEIS